MRESQWSITEIRSMLTAGDESEVVKSIGWRGRWPSQGYHGLCKPTGWWERNVGACITNRLRTCTIDTHDTPKSVSNHKDSNMADSHVERNSVQFGWWQIVVCCRWRMVGWLHSMSRSTLPWQRETVSQPWSLFEWNWAINSNRLLIQNFIAMSKVISWLLLLLISFFNLKHAS